MIEILIIAMLLFLIIALCSQSSSNGCSIVNTKPSDPEPEIPLGEPNLDHEKIIITIKMQNE